MVYILLQVTPFLLHMVTQLHYQRTPINMLGENTVKGPNPFCYPTIMCTEAHKAHKIL